ncbi:hypothetical protein Ancab_015650, partial [Ancistrocladus abbreviatus]
LSSDVHSLPGYPGCFSYCNFQNYFWGRISHRLSLGFPIVGRQKRAPHRTHVEPQLCFAKLA